MRNRRIFWVTLTVSVLTVCMASVRSIDLANGRVVGHRLDWRTEYLPSIFVGKTGIYEGVDFNLAWDGAFRVSYGKRLCNGGRYLVFEVNGKVYTVIRDAWLNTCLGIDDDDVGNETRLAILNRLYDDGKSVMEFIEEGISHD